MKVSSLCVYCGSGEGHDPVFAAETERFGRIIADRGIRLVYGGGAVGLMGVLARSVAAHGGDVLGIIPSFLKDREIALTELGELQVTHSMHERKQAMFEQSDAFVALPGGIGTLEETVEMMTWMQLGRHRKAVVIANLAGFWNPLIALLDHMRDEGFLQRQSDGSGLYVVVDEVDEILPAASRNNARGLDEAIGREEV